MLVAVQLSVLGLYLPPVFKSELPSAPPQTIISLPVQTAVVTIGADGRVGGAGGCPTVGAGIVSPAGVKTVPPSHSAPDDHFAAGPDCRVTSIGHRARWWCWWPSNYPCWDCICRRCSNSGAAIISAPDDHFAAGPHCCVIASGGGRVGGAGGCPTVGAGIVSAAGVRIADDVSLRPRRSFRCRSRLPCDAIGQRARWWCWWLSNCRCWDCISRRCSEVRPDHLRPRRSFRCRSKLPCGDIGQRARW